MLMRMLLKVYLQKTASLRNECSQLLISHQKPFEAVSKDTISRWIKTMLADSGVNTDIFSAHSTRAASTSKAHSSQFIPIDTILAAAGWVKAETFAKFYNKRLSQQCFAYSILPPKKVIDCQFVICLPCTCSICSIDLVKFF